MKASHYLLFTIAILVIYSGKYITESVAIFALVVTVRLLIAIIIGLLSVTLFVYFKKLANSKAVPSNTTLRITQITACSAGLMVLVSLNTTVPDWILSSF